MVDTTVRQFDPNFLTPEELQFATTAQTTSVEDPNVEILDGDDVSDLDEDEAGDELEVPTNITIVSQTARTGADGRTVIDVVISVEEVFGAVKYDLRVTKA